MKNLVTGATGFVGSHIAEKLKQEGEEVIALARKTSDTSFLEKLGVNICYGDIIDYDSVKQAMKGIDRVCHAAAVSGTWVNKKEAHEINIRGTENLLKSSLEHKVKQFIYVSATGVLGLHNHFGNGAEIEEYHLTKDNYIDTKIMAEQEVKKYRNIGLPTTIMRAGVVYGPRDRRTIKGLIESIRSGKFKFIGNGNNITNIVYAGNFADAVYLATQSEKAIGQDYNVTDDSRIRFKDFVYKVADFWDINHPTEHIPLKVAELLTKLFEGIGRVLRQKESPLLTKTKLNFLAYNLEFDISKTKKDLGYEPKVSLEEGLRRTKEWIDREDPYGWRK